MLAAFLPACTSLLSTPYPCLYKQKKGWKAKGLCGLFILANRRVEGGQVPIAGSEDQGYDLGGLARSTEPPSRNLGLGQIHYQIKSLLFLADCPQCFTNFFLMPCMYLLSVQGSHSLIFPSLEAMNR